VEGVYRFTLISFGIRSQSCFLILPASESLIQPCIVLFGNFFLGTPASNRRELRLHLNVVSSGAEVFKSRHILLHKYVTRIIIIYLWRQIQLIIPSRRFRSIECRHFYLFWKYVTWSLFPRITWYSLFHLIYRYWNIRFFFARIFVHMWVTSKLKAYTQDTEVTELSNTFCTSKFSICKYGLQAFICSSYFQLISLFFFLLSVRKIFNLMKVTFRRMPGMTNIFY
jgi:hypothetical protein